LSESHEVRASTLMMLYSSASANNKIKRSSWGLILLTTAISFFATPETSIAAQPDAADSEIERLFQMTMEDLSNVKVTSASLTSVDRRLTPAAVTLITRDQIERSAARSLDELLEIYVPGLQVMEKNSGDAIGIRGINSDRNNKLLMLVNGRKMNNTTAGSHSERFLSMLGDIERIEVVRGPGSAIYGPGAIAGIVNIHTYTGLNFKGTDVQVRQGFIEEFSTLELRHGIKFSDDSGLFLYYGIDSYGGSDQDDSPVTFSHDFTTFDGQMVQANRPIDFDVSDHRESYRDEPRHKAHLHYSNGGFESWLRFTRGGMKSTPRLQIPLNNAPDTLLDMGFGYQQWSILTRYEHDVSDSLRLEYLASYDRSDIWKQDSRTTLKSYGGDEYYFRTMANWTPREQHALALGFEYSHETFGKPSHGYSSETAFVDWGLMGASDWDTDTFSLLGEHQWQIAEPLTLFLGARVDKHTYTNWLFTPRAALIYTPTKRDTVKIIYNHSERRSDDAVLREKHLKSEGKGISEKIDVVELRYERQHSDQFWFALSGHYSDSDIVAWSDVTFNHQDIGALKYYGLELEASYRSERARLTFSHNFTKQEDFELQDAGTTVQNISASPFGYGNDLANWSNHNTKLTAEYDLATKWIASGSIRYIWGYPGAEDMADYNRDELGNIPLLPIKSPSASNRAFEESVFVNLGLAFRPYKHTTLRLDAFNVLGWFDKDLNKRNRYWGVSQYRNEAASIALTAKYSFGLN